MQFLENKMQEQLDHTISIFDDEIIFHPTMKNLTHNCRSLRPPSKMVTEIYNIATVRRRLH